MSRPLRVLLCHPGASWSTSDVYDGLSYGLRQHGVDIIPYRLDERIEASRNALHSLWRVKKKKDPDLPKPNVADLQYHAAVGALEMALRRQVDVVLIVTGMFFHPDVLRYMKQAGLFVTVLFTESPYDHDGERKFAALVDGCWTNERSVVTDLKTVNPFVGYLRHGWHPERHSLAAPIEDTPAHDVVFVGSGFPERIAFFNAIDWTGIDLGLYGHWNGMGLNAKTKGYVRTGPVNNVFASSLYRRAKIGLNLYRNRDGNRQLVRGESLSPRAYELAACGAFHLSEFRTEVPEVFGDCVPTFRTPTEAAALIRLWLADPAGRARLADRLPACVAEASWVTRAATVLGDLQARLNLPGRAITARSA